MSDDKEQDVRDLNLAVFVLQNGYSLVGEINPFLIEKDGAFIIYKPLLMYEITSVIPTEGDVRGAVRPAPFIHPVVKAIPVNSMTVTNYAGYGLIADKKHPLYQQYQECLIKNEEIEASAREGKRSSLIAAH